MSPRPTDSNPPLSVLTRRAVPSGRRNGAPGVDRRPLGPSGRSGLPTSFPLHYEADDEFECLVTMRLECVGGGEEGEGDDAHRQAASFIQRESELWGMNTAG